MVVPSGIVTSEMNAEVRVHVAGGAAVEVAEGIGDGGSGVAVGITGVGGITRVAVAMATVCITFTETDASAVPRRAFVARTVMVCVPGFVAVQD